jgi:ubiquinone/menaquinone biosynthesis C-methylase UbiE
MAMSKVIKQILKKVIPKSQRVWLRQTLTTRRIGTNTYERLYDSYARTDMSDDVVGTGDFDMIGRIELALLQMEGLQPHHTVVDLGCGVGRLAVQIIPTLVGGSYIGIDISQTMLKRANERIKRDIPVPPCRVTWIKQTTPEFALSDRSVDMMCAFSVFTHMEHEDTYRYLRAALPLVRPGGRFIFSCIPLTLPLGKEIFKKSASVDLRTRWMSIRNVATSIDYMAEIARLAGWSPLRWYAGNVANVGPTPDGRMWPLGQTSCVLEAPGAVTALH